MLTNAKTFLRDLWALTKPYWKSEERRASGTLLVTIIALTLLEVLDQRRLHRLEQSLLQRAAGQERP